MLIIFMEGDCQCIYVKPIAVTVRHTHFSEGYCQGTSLKDNGRAHGYWQCVMNVKHDFPEGDCQGMSLKVKIVVDA